MNSISNRYKYLPRVAIGVWIYSRKMGTALVLRRAKPDRLFGTWGPVVGKVNFKESLRQALKREVREETGIVVQPHKAKLVAIEERNRHYPHFLVIWFSYCINGLPRNIAVSSEHNAFKWTPLSRLPSWLPQDIREI